MNTFEKDILINALYTLKQALNFTELTEISEAHRLDMLTNAIISAIDGIEYLSENLESNKVEVKVNYDRAFKDLNRVLEDKFDV